MNWKTSDINGLCISIFLYKMGWFLGIIVKLHNNECLIYIFTGNVENGTPIIFNKTIYSSWYEQLRTHFSPILIDTSHKNAHFFNQIIGEIPGSGVTDPETINPHDFCYQFSKHSPDFLFGKLCIKDFNDEPHFPNLKKLTSSRIKMNMLFKTKDEIKRRICDGNIHKAMRIPVDIHERNKSSLLQFNQKMYVNWNLQIIYGYRFLTNHSLIL